MGGILNTVESMAMGGNSADLHSKVAGGLMEELQQNAGGIGGLIQSLQRNGMGSMVQQWSQGQTQPPNPSAIENGLGGTGIVDSVAQRTGLPAGAIRGSLAVIVPVLLHHMISNNHVSPTGQPFIHGTSRSLCALLLLYQSRYIVKERELRQRLFRFCKVEQGISRSPAQVCCFWPLDPIRKTLLRFCIRFLVLRVFAQTRKLCAGQRLPDATCYS